MWTIYWVIIAFISWKMSFDSFDKKKNKQTGVCMYIYILETSVG